MRFSYAKGERIKNGRNDVGNGVLPPIMLVLGLGVRAWSFRTDFVELIKRTRVKFGVSIQEAHDLIFADEEMRRLAAIRINREPECRKQAAYDLRQHGEQSRFVRDGESLVFRRLDGQRD